MEPGKYQPVPVVPPLPVVTNSTTATGKAIDLLGYAIAKDGAGWGFGLGLLLIAAILWNLSRKIDPIAIAVALSQHIHRTEARLNEITTSGLDMRGKIDELLRELRDIRHLQDQNRQHSLGMSGDLHEIERKVDNTIRQISASKEK